MKQLNLREVKIIKGGVGGGVKQPENPPRGDEKTEQSTNTDGSYQPATLPVEPDEG